MNSQTDSSPTWLGVTLLELQSDQVRWEFSPSLPVLVGRSSDSDVQVKHPRVSRCHAVLFFDQSEWHCSCIGNNGLSVDGRRVTTLTVGSGTVIQLAINGPRLRLELLAPPEERKTQSDSSDEIRVSQWIEGLKAGDSLAAHNLWEHYFDRIRKLARKRLGHASRRVSDEEDVALSVFDSLFEGAAKGQFPDLNNREGLWRLLVVMTARKAIDQINFQRRQKRGGGAVRGESVWWSPQDSDGGSDGFEQLMARDPTPEFAVLLAEQTELLLDKLPDDKLRRIALWKMEGYTNEDIAEQLVCTTRTVERRLREIRAVWSSGIED